MNSFSAVKGIANTVLYEGYLLFPYTASSRKNQVRWQFGVLMPQGYADPSEATAMETYVLARKDADLAHLEMLVRFFQIGDVPVEREIPLTADVTEGEIRFPFQADTLRGSCTLICTSDGDFTRLMVGVQNEGSISSEADRNEALRNALVGVQILLHIDGGSFISLLDPPEDAKGAVSRCRNQRVFPVLVGQPGDGQHTASMALASAIILYDFPAVAPESDGNKFDGTEMDELLNLTVLSLSDAEKDEARATDPAARAILDRAESLTSDQFARMHGKMMLEADKGMEPGETHIVVDGKNILRGSSVRLHPKRKADVWDMFLEGRSARVQAVHVDFENNEYVAVTVDDDPASDLHEWYGRSLFFYPEEVEPLDAAEPAEITP